MKLPINIDPGQLSEFLSDVTAYFSPRVIGEVDDMYIKVAKILGEDIPWHHHINEDELFYIIQGKLLFEVEGREPFFMTQGDIFIVGKGVEHRVSAEEECHIMLFERKSTAHTGEVEADITKSIEDQLGQ
jgi:mannose-6-phosphate isomerase-like protein (cupin superfamily)